MQEMVTVCLVCAILKIESYVVVHVWKFSRASLLPSYFCIIIFFFLLLISLSVEKVDE